MLPATEFKGHGVASGVKTLTFEELPRDGEDPRRDADGAVSTQFCTSGTTGLPKGAMLTGANVLNTGLCLALEMPEMREGGRSLVCMPMFHIGGAGWAVWSMQEGMTLVFIREIVPEDLLNVIVEQKIEAALLVPSVMLFLTELPQARTADFSALKHITYGTAPIAPDLLRRCIEIFKCRFCQVYGLTETTGPFTCLTFEHHVDELLLSCGRPMFGARAKVTGANDEELPPGEIGEICYQGESLMAGYWARPEATAEVMRDGWFHSGDAGYMDENGFIFIKDRIKDMIVSGSENVYPAEVEAILAGAPRYRRSGRDRHPRPEVGRDRESGRGQAPGQHPDRSGADRMGARQDGRLQATALHRFCRQTAAQRQRQAAQAYLARAILAGFPTTRELKRTSPLVPRKRGPTEKAKRL